MVKLSCVLTLSAAAVSFLVAGGCARSRLHDNEAAYTTSSAPAVQAAAQKKPSTQREGQSAGGSMEKNLSSRPPLPQIEVVGTAPGPDYVWIPGHWDRTEHWNWISGHWAQTPRPQASWIPGRWTRSERGWTWVDGFWK